MEQTRGLFPSLFDFSFRAFIASKIIKLLYGLSTVAAGLVALFLIIIGFGASAGMGCLRFLWELR